MTADLLIAMTGELAQVFELLELSVLHLKELKASNWGWFLVVVMLLYIGIYAALIGPLFRFCRRFHTNLMELPLHLLLIVNLILPVILLPLAAVGPSFWLPGLLFTLLYILLICVEAKNVQGDGAVIYMVHSQFLLFIILPTAFTLRLVIDIYRWLISIF